MICHRCLLRAARHDGVPFTTTIRQFSRSSPQAAQQVNANTTTATNPRPNDKPAVLSTSAAQPFSTPVPEIAQDAPHPGGEQSRQPVRVPSSVPAGTVLKGLNFMKNKTDPVAGEDGEYPPWLWGVLENVGKESKDGEAEGDLFAKSKKQRRLAAKALRKQQLLHPELMQPKIPIYEQSIDLPSGDGTLDGAKVAREGREELTKKMREKRRKGIKEGNFLKAMG